MGTVISNLKARFGVDTTDFKKGLKDGESALTDFQGAAGGILDEFASMFGINMNAVNDSIGTANKSLGFLKESLLGAAKGGNVMSISMGVLKWAIVATGIGALVVALGSLIAYFMKTGEGSDKFAKILMQFRSVIDNVIDRLAVFGRGLWEIMTGKFKQGWETMTVAFKGMGDEIKEDWKAAGDLADRFDALDDREIALIATMEERRAKASELRRIAKEETEDQRKKMALITEAENLYKSVFRDQLSLERERLTLMKEQLALQTSDPTDEQRRGIAEQEAKINSLLREQADQLRGLNREKATAVKLIAEEIALEKLKSEQIGITKAEISNIKMPDLSQSSNILAPLKAVKQKMLDLSKEVNAIVESALENMAVGFGEVIGNLVAGNVGGGELGKLVGNTFGDMLVSLGKVAVGVGITIEAIKAAFKTLGGVGAVIAGVALIALGTAIKSSVSASFSGGGGGGGGGGTGSGNGSAVYDTRGKTSEQSGGFAGKTVEFLIRGQNLVGVLNSENSRKKSVT